VVKNLPANAGDMGLIPGPERFPWTLEEEMATLSSILAWEIPWIEAPGGGYSPWGCRRVKHDLATKQQRFLSISKFEKNKSLCSKGVLFEFKYSRSSTRFRVCS